MTKTFQIKSCSIQYGDIDEWWFFKKLWAFIARKKYQRRFLYRIDVETDSNKDLKVGDIFITGLAKPHVAFRIIGKGANKKIIAVSTSYGFVKTPVITGTCAVVAHIKPKSE